ncbi:hypothetical protein K457DRAFT_165064 [Linnemannia elongata AG-77]|uniref:Uncharacterized protein n=1 Tax=Linnemannia elongata AG-77 TaxID=1314771 RepID=A0A197KFZ5_9FUNG|nr:hypothetical protein K457DRAFT_165064 [Linnemannia elongata AG-77]
MGHPLGVRKGGVPTLSFVENILRILPAGMNKVDVMNLESCASSTGTLPNYEVTLLSKKCTSSQGAKRHFLIDSDKKQTNNGAQPWKKNVRCKEYHKKRVPCTHNIRMAALRPYFSSLSSLKSMIVVVWLFLLLLSSRTHSDRPDTFSRIHD